jgi:bud site selection protein 31
LCRFFYELHYVEKKISKPLYEYLVRMKIADGPLIAKWRKPGYEYLCSLQAIDTRNTNYGTTSICRVPIHQRPERPTPAQSTGCVSCCSCDKGAPIWWNTKFTEAQKRKLDEAEEEQELDPEVAERLKRLKAYPIVAPADPVTGGAAPVADSE